MAPPKEGPHAFMTTSNDSLYASTNANGGTDSHYTLHTHLSSAQSIPPKSEDELVVTADLPNESAILSPPSYINQSEDSVSASNMSNMPSRRSVSSASALPASDSHSASDQTFWYDHYYRALDLHNQERKQWDQERQLLRREIDRLRRENQRKQSSSGPSYFPGQENDKVYPDAEVIRQSQEKLRTLSNASHHPDQAPYSYFSARKNSSDISPGEDAPIRRLSSNSSAHPPITGSGQHLASISENESIVESNRRVSINDVSTNITESTTAVSSDQDNVGSPSTTGEIATPPNAKRDAGRTPPNPRMTEDGGLDGASEFTSGFYGPVLDEDPELGSPKALPSAPEKGSVSSEWNDLSRKLEKVASDLEANLPESVRSSAEPFEDSTAPKQHDAGEVKLKTKRSLNFGIPLGAPFQDSRKG